MSPKQNTSVTGSPAHSPLIQAAAAAGVRIRSLGKADSRPEARRARVFVAGPVAPPVFPHRGPDPVRVVGQEDVDQAADPRQGRRVGLGQAREVGLEQVAVDPQQPRAGAPGQPGAARAARPDPDRQRPLQRGGRHPPLSHSRGSARTACSRAW